MNSGTQYSRAQSNLIAELMDLKISEIGWLLLINCLLFENCLMEVAPAAAYFDEAMTVLLTICALTSSMGKSSKGEVSLNAHERLALFLLVVLSILTLFGGLLSEVRLEPMPILIDVFTCIKFPVALLSGYIVFSRSTRLYSLLKIEAKLLLVAMLPFAVLNQFVDIGMRFDTRYGFYSFQFVFGHPASMAAVVVGISVLLFADAKDNGVWLALCWLYLALSLRSTAIAFAAISLLIWIFAGRSGRLNLGHFVAFVPVALYFGWSQIRYYFIDIDGSARRELLDVGFQIANRFFPLGSGYATYASSVTSSPEYYSSLYYQYGLSGVLGLTPNNPIFLSDSFWPIVFGQFGWLGCFIFIFALGFLINGSLIRLHASRKGTLPVWIGFGYLLIASVSSSSFFHPMSVFLAVSIALAVCHQITRRA